MRVSSVNDLPVSKDGFEKLTFRRADSVDRGPYVKGGGLSSASEDTYAGVVDEKYLENLQKSIDSRGMEVSFTVDSETGRAQMVIVETGTGREVLKVPSDSALYQSLLTSFTSLR